MKQKLFITLIILIICTMIGSLIWAAFDYTNVWPWITYTFTSLFVWVAVYFYGKLYL